MIIRELSDDILTNLDPSSGEIVPLLSEFKKGECWIKYFEIKNNSADTTVMASYISKLKEFGLDIGKGETTFGYRMPLPNPDETYRKLMIYRRK